MSYTTKKAMADSLKKLLEKKPLNKVTISDITEDCGINRMTFYYHFKDIYDLIEWICNDETSRAIKTRPEETTWQEGFLAIFNSVRNDRPFFENVYRSVQREQVENYMYSVMYDLLIYIIEKHSEGLDINKDDKEFIVSFYKYAFVGIALNWVKTGMKEPPENLINNISTLIEGQLDLVLNNFNRGKTANEENEK